MGTLGGQILGLGELFLGEGVVVKGSSEFILCTDAEFLEGNGGRSPSCCLNDLSAL